MRAEIQNRTNNGYQVWAIVSVVFTWLASRPADMNFYLLWPTLAIAFGFAGFTIRKDINKAARRIREIEGEINFLAGSQLLKWENTSGSAKSGMVFSELRFSN